MVWKAVSELVKNSHKIKGVLFTIYDNLQIIAVVQGNGIRETATRFVRLKEPKR